MRNWILLLVILNSVSCSQVKILDTSDSARCDPSVRQDCVSVTMGFVKNRVDELAKLKIVEQQLEACQERK